MVIHVITYFIGCFKVGEKSCNEIFKCFSCFSFISLRLQCLQIFTRRMAYFQLLSTSQRLSLALLGHNT